jgi:hydroxymethylpyrimidine pyrophosphatase-like HAD family hydrolase
MACGDSMNDARMIQLAGIGVAMENASEEVKKMADYVTASNAEDGVAKAFEKFVLQ